MKFGQVEDDEAKMIAMDAERLRNDPAFQRAYRYIHDRAVNQLATCSPTDADEIRKAQAYMRVCSDFALALMAAAHAGQQQEPQGDFTADNPTWGTA